MPSTAVTTIAPRTRDSMQSSITDSSAAAGTATTASETSAGIDRTEGHDRWSPMRRLVRVDGVDRSGRARRDVSPQRLTDGVGAVRCTDDGDRSGQQQPRHRSRIGALLAAVDRVEELLGLVEREVEVDDPALEVALDRPTGAAEHRQHRSVVGEHLGGEPLDAVAAGDRREVLEEQGGDALALVMVVDHEGGVGVVAPAPALVAGPRDQLVVALDDERGTVDEVDVGEALELGGRELGLRREVAAVDALGGLAAVELTPVRARRQGGSGGCGPSRRRRARRCWPTRSLMCDAPTAGMMPWTRRLGLAGGHVSRPTVVASPPTWLVLLQFDLDHGRRWCGRTALSRRLRRDGR